MKWYKKNQRDLPWRRSRDPYPVWISEIILQQTRVVQGTDYFLRFIRRFPGIRELAAAEENEVLKIWEGLGYYTRARNLHAAARQIMERHQGVFPGSYDEIRRLKGIGDYTAAAIASISFNRTYPVVDGNVLRFFSRYFGIREPVDQQSGKTEVLQKARELIDAQDPGAFNQAVMEFGALQCRPGVPDCKACPLNKNCFALQNNSVGELPRKSGKPPQRIRYFHYLVITRESKEAKFLYLNKRTGNDIWKNLFDFPLIETPRPASLKSLQKTQEWKSLAAETESRFLSASGIYRHVLSHQIILARFYRFEMTSGLKLRYLKVRIPDLKIYPVPGLIRNYLNKGLQ